MPRSVVLQTLARLWAVLDPLGLPIALIGGLALSVWKHVRATQDVDLVVGVKNFAVDDLRKTLLTAGFRARSSTPMVNLGSLRVLQLEYEPQDAFIAVRVDLLLVDSNYHDVALARRVSIQIPDVEMDLRVLSCEDLILHKLMAGRLIDTADATVLLQLNRETLDFAYLRHWAESLQLESDLARVWGDVYPGESLPHK